MNLYSEATVPELIAKAKERFRPVRTLLLFSGGNDSTVAGHLSREQAEA